MHAYTTPNYGLAHYGLATFNNRSLQAVANVAQDIYSLGSSGSGLINAGKFLSGAALGGALYTAPTVIGVASTLYGAKQIYDGIKGFF
jgi:hypothetical protein